jgi:hypothetical protein
MRLVLLPLDQAALWQCMLKKCQKSFSHHISHQLNCLFAVVCFLLTYQFIRELPFVIFNDNNNIFIRIFFLKKRHHHRQFRYKAAPRNHAFIRNFCFRSYYKSQTRKNVIQHPGATHEVFQLQYVSCYEICGGQWKTHCFFNGYCWHSD